MKFEGNFLPTGIGSLPFREPDRALEIVLKTTPDIPYWPQLVQTGFNENMYVQFAHDLPNVTVDSANKNLYVKSNRGSRKNEEEILSNYISGNVGFFRYDPAYFSGLYSLLKHEGRHKAFAVKGQVTGPLSLGLQITGEDKKPIFYDRNFMEVLTKTLCMKARWQEEKLRKISSTTIISVDEPYLGSIGSGYLTLRREDVLSSLEEVLASISGLKGLHCCSNTDWSLVLEASIDIVFFDAYSDANNLLLYINEVKEFISRGGNIAWGIVPNQSENLAAEDVHTLEKRFNTLIDKMEEKGIKRDDVIHQSLVTTSCGLGNLSESEAMKALGIQQTLSSNIRRKCGLESEVKR